MYGEDGGAGKGQRVALAQGEVLLDAQQVQAHQGDEHADPGHGRAAALEEDAVDGHQDDVEGGDEAALAGGDVEQRGLLQNAGRRQHHAAEDAAFQQHLVVQGENGAALIRGLAAFCQPDEGQQHQAAQEGADAVEGQGRQIVQPHALGHESGAPDEGGDEQKYGMAGLQRHGLSFPGDAQTLKLF